MRTQADPRVCPTAGAGRAGAWAAGRARADPAEPQLQFPAPGAAGGHRALRPPGCHGRQRLLRPLRQDVRPPSLPQGARPLRGLPLGPALSLTAPLLHPALLCRYLRPDVDKKSKHKTCVKKKTLNPEFNEVSGAGPRTNGGGGWGWGTASRRMWPCSAPGLLLRDGALCSGHQDSGSHSLGL